MICNSLVMVVYIFLGTSSAVLMSGDDFLLRLFSKSSRIEESFEVKVANFDMPRGPLEDIVYLFK